MVRVVAALLVAALIVAAPMPLAHADDPGACVDAGHTVEWCDQKFLAALASTGLDYDPATAIAVAHNIADVFAAHPTKATFVAIVNRKIKDTTEGNCIPTAPACDPTTINVDQAVFIVQRAIIFYGPPGLEDTMNSVMGG